MSTSTVPKKRKRELKQESPEMPDKHDLFTKWSRDRGVEINNVKAAAIPGRGIGLVTTSKIDSGDRIMFVPEKAMFKPNADVLGKHASKTWQQKASPHAQLAVSLAQECCKDSSPYLTWKATWPTYEDIKASMPLFWSEDLRGYLPPSIQQPLERQMADFEKDRSTLNDFDDLGSGWAGDPFEYYWAIVNSRSFHFKPAGSKPGFMVLCPFVDYMNHGPDGTGVKVKQTARGYEVHADRDYVPGEEILATYGAHPNDKLLVHYGFVNSSEPGGPTDDDIRLDHIILPDMAEATREALQDVGFLGGYALLPRTNELCFKTEVAIRAILLTANEWEYFIANGEDLSDDQSGKVQSWLKPRMKEYRTVAASRQSELEKLEVKDHEQEAARLLKVRWKQIQNAVDAFLAES